MVAHGAVGCELRNGCEPKLALLVGRTYRALVNADQCHPHNSGQRLHLAEKPEE